MAGRIAKTRLENDGLGDGVREESAICGCGDAGGVAGAGGADGAGRGGATGGGGAGRVGCSDVDGWMVLQHTKPACVSGVAAISIRIQS